MKIVNKILLSLLAVTVLSSAPASALTWSEVKEFGHKHRTKILVGTGVVVTAVAVVAGVLVWRHYRGAPAAPMQLEPMFTSTDTTTISLSVGASSGLGGRSSVRLYDVRNSNYSVAPPTYSPVLLYPVAPPAPRYS